MPWRTQLSLLLATPENGFSSTSSTSSIAFRNEEREPAWTVACCCAGESSMALTCWCEACVSWSAANMAKPATTRRLTTSATHLRTPSTTTLKIGRPWSRLEAKAHGLQRRIEGPPLDPGERCLIVEDVVTTGGSTLRAIEAVREAGATVCGVVAVLDRLAGGAEAIEAAAGAPYEPLTTIDDVYPDRPDG